MTLDEVRALFEQPSKAARDPCDLPYRPMGMVLVVVDDDPKPWVVELDLGPRHFGCFCGGYP